MVQQQSRKRKSGQYERKRKPLRSCWGYLKDSDRYHRSPTSWDGCIAGGLPSAGLLCSQSSWQRRFTWVVGRPRQASFRHASASAEHRKHHTGGFALSRLEPRKPSAPKQNPALPPPPSFQTTAQRRPPRRTAVLRWSDHLGSRCGKQQLQKCTKAFRADCLKKRLVAYGDQRPGLLHQGFDIEVCEVSERGVYGVGRGVQTWASQLLAVYPNHGS